MMLKKTLLCSVLLAAIASPALAQEKSDIPFVLDPGKIELKALIDRAATHLGHNILVNEQELMNSGQGGSSIELQQRVVTDSDGCEDLLTTLLYARGFGIIVLDAKKHVYEVIAINGPRIRELFNATVHRSPEEVLARPNLVMPVTTVVQLQHVNAMVANNALRPFFANAGSPHGGGVIIGTAGNQSAMLISGMQNRVANAIRLVRECDVPPSDAPPDLEQRLARIEQRLSALEQKLGAGQGENAPQRRRQTGGGR